MVVVLSFRLKKIIKQFQKHMFRQLFFSLIRTHIKFHCLSSCFYQIFGTNLCSEIKIIIRQSLGWYELNKHTYSVEIMKVKKYSAKYLPRRRRVDIIWKPTSWDQKVKRWTFHLEFGTAQILCPSNFPLEFSHHTSTTKNK